ncbi:MAG: diphosphomevalonate decarboxylase [Myxococcota bacterium]
MPVATACANIALVKYWGKRDAQLNLPAAGSLSLTLDALQTRTQVELIDEAEDRLELDGQRQQGRALKRITEFADIVRARADSRRRVAVTSTNAFPTAAGLASSASAFAALAVAVSEAMGVSLSPLELSALARQGSGSAARSIFGGYALMHAGSASDGHDAFAEPLADIDLSLHAVIAVAAAGPKSVGSTEGMELTRETSPYHRAWLETVERDLGACQEALRSKDLDRLATIVEGNCLAMHANAMAARPGIIYFRAATLWAIEQVRKLRASGTPVFFTIDAGPHVVAFTLAEHVAAVKAALTGHPDVAEVLTSAPGLGAALVDEP